MCLKHLHEHMCTHSMCLKRLHERMCTHMHTHPALHFTSQGEPGLWSPRAEVPQG